MLVDRRAERRQLDQLLDSVREGRGRVLVVHGEAGIGKTTLLEYLCERAAGCRVLRVSGARAEAELPFSALHRLCASLLDGIPGLPEPQSNALEIALGLRAGAAPDRFLVGLAVLSLLAEAADERALVCLVDDAHWLDRASAQALAFVARRIVAEHVALIFGARDPLEDELGSLPGMPVSGLAASDAHELLGATLPAPLDDRVRARLVDETGGNPLALVELPRGLTPAELAGGFGLPNALPVPQRIEESFRRRFDALADDTRRLLLVAAAEPTGDALLVSRAAVRLGVDPAFARPLDQDALCRIDAEVRFAHPLVGSAIYRAAAPEERRIVHGALAEATDAAVDPDRRAWHRAEATAVPDEAVACELVLAADRARARGGVAAAAAFLQRAAVLSPDLGDRADRALEAAAAKRDASAFDEALGLVVLAEACASDVRRRAAAARLRGQILFLQRHSADAYGLLLDAATQLEAFDVDLARETHFEALGVAMWTSQPGDDGIVRCARAALRAAPPSGPPRPIDVLLDGFATRCADDFVRAAPTLARALEHFSAAAADGERDTRWLWAAGNILGLIGLDVWDDAAVLDLPTLQVERARATGAFVRQQFALSFLVNSKVLAGELAEAETLAEEQRTIAEATGSPNLAYSTMAIAAFRGGAGATAMLDAAVSEAVAHQAHHMVDFFEYAAAVAHNGAGDHGQALEYAWRLFERDRVGYGPLILPELLESAARSGRPELAERAIAWLSARADVVGSEWARGVVAQGRALIDEGPAAEAHFVEAVERLDRTRIRVQAARSRLLYGEWLRRQRRRRDARRYLAAAHESFTGMGLAAYAERAARELLATGERARRRTVETRDVLTPQEATVARLASAGMGNREIAARLLISPRTVQYHLHKVFAKLGISSRTQLPRAMSTGLVEHAG